MDHANVADLKWNRIDLDRRCCYIPSYQSKGGDSGIWCWKSMHKLLILMEMEGTRRLDPRI
jgi:hypothetical protein